MGENVIILTTGLSGSSLVTLFISQAGYWAGDQTVRKNNSTGKYDTLENKRIIELNSELMNSISYPYNNDAEYHNEAHFVFEEAHKTVNAAPYKEFINYCYSKGKWIWKDPRLWLTIGFWHSLLNKSDTKFILLYRDPFSLWVSLQNKRQIVSYQYLKRIEKKSREKLAEFLKSRGIDYHLLCYDKLIQTPDKVIPGLNDFLGTRLSLNDLENVYNGDLGKQTWNYKKLIMAVLIYIKNYSRRRHN